MSFVPPKYTPPPIPAATQAPRPYRKRSSPAALRYAKASLVAPGLAMALGLVALGIRDTSQTVDRVLIISVAGLLVVGIISGLIAVILWLVHRTEGVLPKAIGGLSLIICVIAAGAYTAYDEAKILQMKRREVWRKDLVQSGMESFYQAGWFGVLNDSSKVVTLVAVPDNSPMGATVRGNIQTPCSVIVVSVQNHAVSPLTVDPQKAKLRFKSGRTAESLDWKAVAASARDREPAEGEFYWPYTIEPRATLEGRVLFIPPDMDMHDLESIEMQFNDVSIRIPGRWMTTEDKRGLRR